MNRDDIVRMAREQGLPETEVEGVFRVNSDDLGRMLAAEREACAKVCEDDPSRAWDWLGEIRPGGHYAAAIRAQAADRLARHGIQLPDEDDHDGNPSF